MASSKGTKGTSAGSNLKPFYVVLAIVAVVGAAALGWSVLGGGGQTATEPVSLDGVTDPQALLDRANGMVLGEDDAPITVIEFGDFQCPACGQWAGRIKPLLKAEYIDTGKIRFIFYDFPLAGHQHAFVAARAARCAADQGRYWDYHDRLYGAQGNWSFERNPVGEFVDYAEELGLDAGTFESCVESDQHAEVVSASRQLAIQLGVGATPTVIVNGKAVPQPFDYEALKRTIDAELGG